MAALSIPMHDWTRIDSGVFHSLHLAWITHLKEALTDGLLPDDHYALAEPHFGRRIADVLTRRAPRSDAGAELASASAALSLADAPPRVARRVALSADAAYRAARRTLAIRRVSGHRIVALIEIASPGNKDRPKSVAAFAHKVCEALRLGVHVLVVDPLPPGPHDPRGMHGAIWDELDGTDDEPPSPGTLTLASYLAEALPEAFVETVRVGQPLPEMPVFLDVDLYVPTPLERTYAEAYRGLPAYWRGVVETGERPA
jgi:hypothetical protein